MNRLEEKNMSIVTRKVNTDVLVVGHGIAGLATAISIKEDAPKLKVTTVDKACVGYAGKANKGGGHVAFIPEGAEEQYVEYHTRNLGDYLNNQDMLRIYANSTNKVMDRWEAWGVKFVIPREHAGNAHPIIPWKITLVDLDVMIHMGRHARKLGVESIEKTTVTELLTDDNRVVGALGMDLITGDIIVFKAKAVVLCNGDQNFSVLPMWQCGKGDGIAAAYRAGAKMRNAEFGSFVNMVTKSSKTVSYGAEDALVNAKGENSSSRADLDPSLKTVVGGVDLGGAQSVLMYLETRDGNGPIYEDTTKNHFPGSFPGKNLCCLGLGEPADPPFFRPVAQKFWDRLWFKNRMGSFKDDNPLKETVPGLVGEMSPLYVDNDMVTSIQGLFAAGDICACGSSWSGAVPTPPGRNRGSGLMHAVLTSTIAAASAAKYAQSAEQGKVSDDQVKAYAENLLAPFNTQGDLTSHQVMWELKNIMQPVEYTGYKNEERLTEALNKVLRLKEKLPMLTAKDPHGVNAVNECKSTVLCAEMFFRASLMRKESRGWHLREDYKERDDKNYLKWIIIKNEDGSMSLTTENVPMDSYKYKPE
jgi:succinate dehydrogenase / fumarate reductase flavoprotein subunit